MTFYKLKSSILRVINVDIMREVVTSVTSFEQLLISYFLWTKWTTFLILWTIFKILSYLIHLFPNQNLILWYQIAFQNWQSDDDLLPKIKNKYIQISNEALKELRTHVLNNKNS